MYKTPLGNLTENQKNMLKKKNTLNFHDTTDVLRFELNLASFHFLNPHLLI
jgi:hypothetical protein